MGRITTPFTDRTLAATQPEPGKQIEHSDPMTPGLALRVTGAGKKTWTFRYRNLEGRQARLSFGHFPAVRLKDARGLALDVLAKVRGGEDPARARRRQRHTLNAGVLETWNDLAARYFEERAAAKKSGNQERQLWAARFAQQIGKLELADLSRAHVRAYIRKIGENGAPIYANRAQALLRQIGNFGVEIEVLENNPAHGIRKQFAETTRDRVLNDEEIAAIWNSLELVACTRPMALAIRMLLTTGQRRSEVAGLHARELNLADRIWIIPATRTKNKREHVVPLSDLAMTLLSQACGGAPPEKWRGYAFSSAFDRTTPLDASAISHAVMRATDRLGLADVRTHDLRRTCATYMTSEAIGASRDTVARVLNHVSAVGGVTAIYDRNAYAKEKRAALQAWGERLEQIADAAHLDIYTGNP